MSNNISHFLDSRILPAKIQIVMICETLPANPADNFYNSSDSLYIKNIILALNSASEKVKDIDDIINKGIYLTVAVKEPRIGLTVPTDKIKKYTHILEQELNIFSNLKAIILMGDVAIKAFNYLTIKTIQQKIIPTGSTYKIRKNKYYFKQIRVFPSYLPTGKNFLIEKSKRKMVAEDIKVAFKLITNENKYL